MWRNLDIFEHRDISLKEVAYSKHAGKIDVLDGYCINQWNNHQNLFCLQDLNSLCHMKSCKN